MAVQIRVTHGLSDEDDIYPGEHHLSVEEGVLLVFRDATRMQAVKVYNRDVWAAAEYEEAP